MDNTFQNRMGFRLRSSTLLGIARVALALRVVTHSLTHFTESHH
jgi:hypothetical protein